MSVAAPPLFELDDRFARELPELCRPWAGVARPDAELVLLNERLAAELGLAADRLRAPEAVAVLAGQDAPPGAVPVSQAYAGHQFGGFSPSLGDGRAVLLGELTDTAGRRRDLHLKGSGRTPFARGGDGQAVLGPMLREYVLGEAMHALGIPTTRALAVVATGEDVVRERPLPGAVLARVAASHLRVGTFQFAAAHHGPELVRRLIDHAIARHDPAAAEADRPALAFLAGVVERQAALVARWMLVGFVHGVMNTDNTTISGETIDYGPCAFVDAYDPATVFSSIDHGGRYAFGNQPRIMQWNLARLAETLLPLIDTDVDVAVERATAALHAFPDRYRAEWRAGMRAKLGLTRSDGGGDHERDDELVDEWLELLRAQRVDFTSAFRALAGELRGGEPARSLFAEPEPFERWRERWYQRIADPAASADDMDAVNPVYIPRNHHVERVLDAATGGDLAPLERFLEVLAHPFTERPELAEFAGPAPAAFGPYRTFCGT